MKLILLPLLLVYHVFSFAKNEAPKKDPIKKAPLSVKEVFSPKEIYFYSSYERSDPFIPPLLSSLLAVSEIPIVSVLQRFPTNELKVVGLWKQENNESKVLIMTPKDAGVVAMVGDYVGNRGGKIVSIDESSIKVREFTLASDGARRYYDFSLWLTNEGPEKEDKEDKIIIKADEIGRARQFGFGRYAGKRRQDLQKAVDENENTRAPDVLNSSPPKDQLPEKDP